MYVYIQSEPSLFTVGFYAPDGSWHPDSDHLDRIQASERVSYLNGNNKEEIERLKQEIESLRSRVEYMEEEI